MTVRQDAPNGTDVHLWPLEIDRSFACDEALLNDAERKRAARFIQVHDRTRFVAAHAAKRRILGAYIGVPPENCAFVIQAHGKPGLAGEPRVQFSMTHSGDRAVVAVSSDVAVGVDLELPRFVHDADALAAEVATDAEVEALRALRPSDREGAFFCLWTRKEAALKACGTGLSGHPRELDVGCSEGLQLATCPQTGRAVAIRSMPMSGGAVAVARLDALGAIVVCRSTAA